MTDQPMGSLDGNGCADHDMPYLEGLRHPTADAPFPFTTRQFAHLLALKATPLAEAVRGQMTHA